MSIFNRPIFVSKQDRLFAEALTKVVGEMRQAHEDESPGQPLYQQGVS